MSVKLLQITRKSNENPLCIHKGLILSGIITKRAPGSHAHSFMIHSSLHKSLAHATADLQFICSSYYPFTPQPHTPAATLSRPVTDANTRCINEVGSLSAPIIYQWVGPREIFLRQETLGRGGD